MPAPKNEDKLTKKQEDFVLAYLETGSAAQAYRRTCRHNGNDETIRKAATKKIHEPKIARRAAALRAAIVNPILKRISIDRELIITQLLEQLEISMGRRLVKIKVYRKSADKIEEIEVSQYNATAALRALELLGKIDTIGLFVERSKVDITSRFDAMTDDELDEFIASNGARIQNSASPGDYS